MFHSWIAKLGADELDLTDISTLTAGVYQKYYHLAGINPETSQGP